MTEPSDIVVAKQMPPAESVQYEAEVDSGSLASVLQHRWRTMFLVSTILAAASCSAIWLVVRPKYSVGSTVHIAPTVRPILFKDTETDISRHYHTFMNTQARFMVSPGIIRRTLDRTDIRSLPSIIGSPTPAADVASRVKVDILTGTQLLQLTMIGEHPEDAATIVNGLLDTYLTVCEERKKTWDERILGSLRRQQNQLGADLSAKTVQLHELADSVGLDTADSGDDNQDSWVTKLRELLTEAQTKRAVAAARMARLDASKEDEVPPGIEPVGFEAYLRESQKWQATAGQLAELERAALDDERLRRGPAHPEVAARPQRIAALRERLSNVRAEVLKKYRDLLRWRLEADLLRGQTTVQALQEELDNAMRQRVTHARDAFVIEDMRHQRDHLEQALVRVRDKIWNVEIEQNRMARVTIDSPAVAPEAPNIDKRPKYVAAACFMSLMIGVGIALLRDRLDTSIHDPREVTRRLGVPLLGSVQYVPNCNGPVLAGDERILDPIRGISAALLTSSCNGRAHTRLITSPTVGSGKSSMAMNLARSLASTGRRVLLVDADNAGQGVTEAFELTGHPGLKELFEDTCHSDQTIYQSDIENLQILPAGQRLAHFGELLAKQHAQETVTSLFGTYDDVVIDSAPVLANSNAVVLATMVDEVILVLRAGKSTREEAQAARHILSLVGDKLVGVIFNAVDRKGSTYPYYYGYTKVENVTDG